MRKLQVSNQLQVICLNTPPRPTWGHSMHVCDQAPFNQITQQGCQLTGLELKIQKIIFRESGPVKSWRPPQKFSDPPDPLRIDSFIYQPIALDVRIPSM